MFYALFCTFLAFQKPILLPPSFTESNTNLHQAQQAFTSYKHYLERQPCFLPYNSLLKTLEETKSSPQHSLQRLAQTLKDKNIPVLSFSMNGDGVVFNGSSYPSIDVFFESLDKDYCNVQPKTQAELSARVLPGEEGAFEDGYTIELYLKDEKLVIFDPETKDEMSFFSQDIISLEKGPPVTLILTGHVFHLQFIPNTPDSFQRLKKILFN